MGKDWTLNLRMEKGSIGFNAGADEAGVKITIPEMVCALETAKQILINHLVEMKSAKVEEIKEETK